ncbi:MAG: hypothetical protein H7839_23870 [Magnetococcus sp. YQC-5]
MPDQFDTMRDKLINIVASGQKRVTHGDKSVEFQDPSSAFTALSLIEQARGRSSGTSPIKTFRSSTSKGL